MEPDATEVPSEVPSSGSLPDSEPHWRVLCLIDDEGREPPADLSEATALGVWSTISAPWHPAVLAQLAELPRVEPADSPSEPGPCEVRVLAPGAADRIPSGHRTQAADVGTILIEGEPDREALIRRLLGCLRDADARLDADDPVVLDFLALGAARWWLRSLTVAMGHIDYLDLNSLTRETLTGARAWHAGDRTGATNRLRAAFELLTQARERLYPVDAYIVDLCLLDPSLPAGALADALDARAPVSFLAPASAIEALDRREPESLARLRAAINDGWADVAGGAYAEVDEPLRPLESILWQFQKGSATYRRLLDDRNVETLARRRFGLYPQLPQIARRFGFRFALHLGLDDGRFPVPTETKRLWEAPDGSSLESLFRPPIAADRAAEALTLPWRLARTMKDDHVATVAMVHWPSPLAGWYRDLRRVAAYSPVLARWVTLGDYFHLTDRPFEMFRPELDQYVTPYLSQAVARGDPAPISRRAAHARLRTRVDALSTLRALDWLLNLGRKSGAPGEGETPGEGAAPREGEAPAEPQLEGIPTESGSAGASPSRGAAPSRDISPEDALETGHWDRAEQILSEAEPVLRTALGRSVLATTSKGRPGYLVLNPAGVSRCAPVRLPDASADLRPEGPLRAAQLTEEGVWAVVNVPAFGYAWVPRETATDQPPAPTGAIGARGQKLFNESIEVEIDAATGGIRSLHAPGEPTARLGQQLVVVDPEGNITATKMRGDLFEVDYGGPALVQARTTGALLDPRDQRLLARFQQRYRLWSGRPIVELDITLSDLDPMWLERLARGDPWASFLSCRWAWPDPNAELRRTSLLGPEPTHADRPETPDVFELASRKQRTALLFGGLAHHQRHGQRMLDTILCAGRESCREFRLGVAIDHEYPFHASQDFAAPLLAIACETGPPTTGSSGWFFHLDHKAIAVTRVERSVPPGDSRGPGLAFHVLETSGRAARCQLRLVHNPTWARQTDFHREPIVDLPVEGDAVLIDLTPHELARVEVTFE